ncbi:MAG TPA: hypothetical protein VEB20_00350 [Azospirillaceae bacterium]|nr:hypothetical protein [Azospirillaceae bacterium]
MRPAVLARKTHKWLALLIGIQALVWAASGLYMVAVPIGIIHGDHLVHAHGDAALPLDQVRIGIAEVRRSHGEVRSIRLKSLLGTPYYVVEKAGGAVLVDAVTGRERTGLDEATARALARQYYTGEGEIVSLRLLEEAPQEIQGRPAPLWQARFAGWNDPTLYISHTTGDLLARRHELWRVFDFLWMLHIMDYETREDVNNTLLRVATLSAVVGTGSGLWLLFHSFRRRQHPAGRR